MDFAEACQAYRLEERARFNEASDAIITAAARGLTYDQAAHLAECISESGDKVDIPTKLGPLADSPSTGGPASLSTLLCPLLIASERIKVPKLSATGSIAGAIDSMAIIPGFRYDLAGQSFVDVLERSGFAHAEPSERFCPADTSLVTARRKANMMTNPWLAAASLLAKKLAIPGVFAAFDFRVGSTGNIGRNADEAKRSAEIFFRIAEKLNVSINVTLTDNHSFPCSALGRLESLDLLWGILSGFESVNQLDKAHVDTCIQIAARACALCKTNDPPNRIEQRLHEKLRSGEIVKVFESHIEAQGTSLETFKKVLATRASQSKLSIVSPDGGYWMPPNLSVVKNYAKDAQATVGGIVNTCADLHLDRQFGMRLQVSPGDRVEKGQPVIEFRYPHGAQLPPVANTVLGSIVKEQPSEPQYIIQHLSEATLTS